jgi:putative holliday junction resolvase
VALSDPRGILASPLTVIARTTEPRDIQAILDIVKEHQAALIVAGLPLSMDGQVREQASKVQTFLQSLAAEAGIPLEYRDERLSTRAARRSLREAPHKKSDMKKRDDAAAAAVILQGYLEEKLP